MSFSCPPGTEIDWNNIIYGIMSPKLALSYYCTEAAILDNVENDKFQKCTNYMD
jgi:hypothetical protein